MKWSSQKMVGPFFIFASVAQWQSTRDGTDTRGRIPYRPWLPTSLNRMPVMIKTVHPTQALVRLQPEAPQGGDRMPGRARKTSRQFEKDKATFFAQCKAQHAVCWLCGMPIDYNAVKNTTDDSFNLDHLYPVSKHPELQFDPAGFKPSHTSCNRLRGNSDPPAPIGTLSRQWITTA